MAQIINNLNQLYFNKNEYFLFVDFKFYKKWWLLIWILIFFKKGYKNCLFFRSEYKFYKKVAVVGMKSNRKVRRRTKGYSKKFLETHKETDCLYCNLKLNKENSSVDHIIPISKGGNNSQINLVVVCKDCNNERGDLEFKTYLRIKNKEYQKIKYPFI